MHLALGVPLILAGMFGPAYLVYRGAHVPDEKPAQVSNSDPSSAQTAAPAPRASRPIIRRRASWQTISIGLVLLAALFQYIDRDSTENTARKAMQMQLREVSDKGWEIDRASLPVFTLLEGRKTVDFILSNGDRVRRFSIMIDGMCFTGCSATWSKLQAVGM